MKKKHIRLSNYLLYKKGIQMFVMHCSILVEWWRNEYGIRPVIETSWVQLEVRHCCVIILQIVHILVSLSRSCIIWYWCKNREGNGTIQKRCGLLYITLAYAHCQLKTISGLNSANLPSGTFSGAM